MQLWQQDGRVADHTPVPDDVATNGCRHEALEQLVLQILRIFFDCSDMRMEVHVKLNCARYSWVLYINALPNHRVTRIFFQCKRRFWNMLYVQ